MIVGDVSWWQEPMDVAAMAPSFSHVIVRWCDWKAWTNGQDDDPDYNRRLVQFREQGVPSTGYLFARPQMASAQEQIDTWAARTTTSLDFSPLLDVEVSGITGPQLQDWVEEALARMGEIWGMPPLWYSSASLAHRLGTVRPDADHLLMVPGYPYRDDGRIRYRQGQEDSWVLAAGGPQTMVDYMPPGYTSTDVALWQFASTANVAGTANSVDVSHPYPAFLQQFEQPPPAPGRICDLIAILQATAPLVVQGRLAEPIANRALEELRGLLSPAAADVLLAQLSSGTDGH